MGRLKVIFCIPGNQFSMNFIQSWTNLISDLPKLDIEYECMWSYNPNIYRVRNGLLGGNPNFGKNQKPFNGTLDYDYIMWIDSDMVFKSTDFEKLISHDVDIVSGAYFVKPEDSMDIPFIFACLKETIDNRPVPLTTLDISNKNNLIEVEGNGMGFMLVKRGVFENMKYPWFEPYDISNDIISDFESEDISFQVKARKNGYKSYVDPNIILGHEKSIILELN